MKVIDLYKYSWFGDFVPTDADIALHGAGHDQILAMYNWWRRVTLALLMESLERTSVAHWNAVPAGTLAAA